MKTLFERMGDAARIEQKDAMSQWPGFQKCDCGDDFPLYGVAPHECYWRKGPEYQIGQSTLLHPSEWRDLFVPDLNEGETWDDFLYPCGTGIFYCPQCQHGRYAKAWEALVSRIGKPPAQGIEAGTATTGTGVVHESPVRQDAPETPELGATPTPAMGDET